MDTTANEENSPKGMNYMVYNMKKLAHQKMLAELPSEVRHKLRALKKLQLETIYLDADFHKNVYDLEQKYNVQYNTNFTKRFQIINGDYNPNKEECYQADPDSLMEPLEKIAVENSGAEAMVKGIPNFWLNVLKFTTTFNSMVKEGDEPALKHLIDVRVVPKALPDLSFSIEFHFIPNEFFENAVLTKEYFMKCAPDTEYPFTFDGPEIYKSQGCEINWKPGKDLRYKSIKKKSPDGQLRLVKVETFFNFFYPPDVPEDVNDPNFDFITSILETDFEIGHYLKERVIPKAVLFFTGEIDDDIEESDISSSSGSEVSDNIEISEENIDEKNYGDGAN